MNITKPQNFIKYLPYRGFVKSRLTYLIIFFLTISKLNKLLRYNKPDYLIAHLITSIPLVLYIFFNYKTRLILRISGYPKISLFRKILWKLASKKIFRVTVPTNATLKFLVNQNIFDQNKIIYLPDPVLKIKETIKMSKEDFAIDNKFFKIFFLLAIGRLTKQKNFSFLIESFHQLNKKYQNYNLYIIGDGEQKEILNKKIKNLNMEKKIFLLGYKKNIFPYLKNSKAFILSSLWEDPGFVLIEAGLMNKIVLSSDCPNGPVEILNNGKNGFLFKSNSTESFINNFEKMVNEDDMNIAKMKINLKKKCKEFTLYNHYKILNSIVNE